MSSLPPVHCALVHHPVLDRAGGTITTAVTNLDIHDIARSARSYGLAGYWVVTPIEAQRILVDRVLDHWRDGAGARRIPERSQALSLVRIVPSVEAAIAGIESLHAAGRPRVVATAARTMPDRPKVDWGEARRRLTAPTSRSPELILFGTGHGLAEETLDLADELLPPIQPGGRYNHLSVRAAAAIVFDRLLSAG